MDKTQADAVSEAILEPHLRAQEARASEIRARRAAAEALDARKRVSARFALVGMAVGAAVAHVGGFRYIEGAIWGGLAGFAVSMVVRRRAA